MSHNKKRFEIIPELIIYQVENCIFKVNNIGTRNPFNFDFIQARVLIGQFEHIIPNYE